MSFHSPEYFVFLLLIPLYLYFSLKKKNTGYYCSVVQDLKKAQGKFKNIFFPTLKHLVIILLIFFFTLSLARMQKENKETEISKKGVDIIIAFDVSESMLAEDLKPNRMEAAKDSIKSFIKLIKNDRLGIILFAGKAFTQSPLTFDANILTEYLDRISTTSINQQVRGLNGTAVGDAILSAINRFTKSEERSKVLILLTDGDANTGVDPLLAAKKAASENIKIYTIGIGKEGGAPLPVIDRFGNKDYARNYDGSLFMSTFNEASLKEISKITKGKYYRASNKQSFQKILEAIDQLEKKDITTSISTHYDDHHQLHLYLTVLFFIFFLLIKFFYKIP